jgi:ElaB/YqjD/DUF883 family membrane-anchored ribosome-binding protein
MPSESPEVIEKRLAESRRQLTAKVHGLENEVVDTAHETTKTLRQTMQSLQSGVEETFATVNGGVNETIRGVVGTTSDAVDLRPQIRANPLAAVGASFAAGLVAGLLVTRQSSSHVAPVRSAYAVTPGDLNAVRAPTAPSWIDGLLDQVAGEVKRMSGEVMEQAAAEARRSLHDGVPGVVHGLLSRVTAAVNPQPTPQPGWPNPGPQRRV